MQKHILYIIFLLVFSVPTFSQNKIALQKADSFAIEKRINNAKVLHAEKNYNEESRNYNEIAEIYWNHFYLEEAIKYFEKSIVINKMLGNKSGVSMINSNLGSIYTDLKKYDKALVCFNKNLEYKRLVKDKRGKVSSLINISIALNHQKKYEESIIGLLKALDIARELSDTRQMKSCYGMLSETYEKAKDPDKAIYYFSLYKSFHDKLRKDKETEAQIKYREATLKLRLTETENRNNELELQLADKELKEKDKQLLEAQNKSKLLYSNLSKSDMQNKLLQRDKEIAEMNTQKEKEIVEKQKTQMFLMYSIIILAILILLLLVVAYIQKRKTTIKLSYQNKKILLQKSEIEKLSIVASRTDNSVMIASGQGDIEWINNGFTKMYGYKLDELLNTNVAIHNLDYIKSSEPEIIKTLQEKETQVYESLLKCKNGKEKWVQTTLTPILDDDDEITKLIFIDSDIQRIKESERKITQQKEQIERQQISLTDSINYAQYIQEAILYKNFSTKDLVSDNFVMYKPKDVVSGDFYWFSKINGYTIIVASDCTGHGVPGAFLSLIGVNILNQIVNHEKTIMPDEIIHKLHHGFIESLNQDENENTDGMDLAICTIDNKNKKLYYAGANRPLIYIQDDKVETIRGDINSVGGLLFQKGDERNFTIHEIDINKETSFYLSSDGYVDQFGGPANKKFNNANFYALIDKAKNMPFSEQKILFENTFDKWKGDYKQIDDILVIGVKI